MVTLRCELKAETEAGCQNHNERNGQITVEAAWDAIDDIQEELKASCASRKKLQTDLDSQSAEIVQLSRGQLQLDDHRKEIEDLKTKLAEEQEKVIALETYSRRENLRFMNIPEERGENCIDTIYDLIENEVNINTEHMQLQAVHQSRKSSIQRRRQSFSKASNC